MIYGYKDHLEKDASKVDEKIEMLGPKLMHNYVVYYGTCLKQSYFV